jgi:hypothetical protein
MGHRRYALIAGGFLLYCGIAVAFLARLPIIERVIDLLPPSVVAFVLAVVGPAVLFSGGIGAWPAVAVVVILVATLLGLARFAWRRWPETEWFAVWLICAGVVWVGLTWLLIAVAEV